jgi:AAT family amino acid transporter/D-serine/D-alanine/glycine transporter
VRSVPRPAQTAPEPLQEEAEELVRGLSHRQLQMMAIGGTIGVGLFLGSGKAISAAGPAVIICYLVAGAVVFLMLRALGEMAVDRPTSGSFATYAEELVGRWAGYATGWTYWLMWITSVMAEITAIGIYTRYFFHGVPQWLPALASVAVLLSANLVSVRLFGEAEFWFALIKIVAILAFIGSGVAILAFGIGHLGHASLSNLWSHGGFFPEGVLGPLLAFQIITFAFLGVEMIGVAAGEARDPRRELPRAINRVAWRILLFYVGAILIVLMLIPWDEVNLKKSPFVVAWSSLGIGAAAGILNGVVLTSALSSCNSGIFASARMLHALARSGVAPRQLRPLNRRHVPARALVLSGIALSLGVVINIISPGKAFIYITSVATVGVLWVWGMIVVTHLRYRALVRSGDKPGHPFRMPGSPWTNYVVLAYIALVAVLFGVAPNQRVALAAGGVWAAVLAVGWWRMTRPHVRGRVALAEGIWEAVVVFSWWRIWRPHKRHLTVPRDGGVADESGA